ncbi:RNA polymerase sigma factor [Kibdelosporangium persicum]|uniref:RNA polymerase sigma factor n=1 Tax=Kibdelosporangium persicum TaxID=2698649 RepID=A0ABX2FGX8_9PSEU|nr:RNA polymerase sigma factor [Kibdelosporangium persicum]
MTEAIEEAFRAEWGRVVATLIRLTGDWDLAEECTQEAFARAMAHWPQDGVPRRPGAWLTTTARNRALDRIRRAAAETNRLADLATIGSPEASTEDSFPDDRLKLMFTCCHPALPLEAQVALTLRTLTGMTTPEIARAFLVPEPTMAQRLVRAKRKIHNARIPYRVPPPSLLPERTSGVLGVLYLLFNQGYSNYSLVDEAIRLTRVLVSLMPHTPEASGLLALMLFHNSRRDTRLDASGDLVTLEDQDRSRWDQELIEEGIAVLDAALEQGHPGPYQLQAAIAACHATAPTASDTDWPRIAMLYEAMLRLNPSPVIELNRAVAVAMASGPSEGLALLDSLQDKLTGYHLLPATRADFLRRLGRIPEAAEAYREALELAPTDAERRFLTRRLSELDSA